MIIRYAARVTFTALTCAAIAACSWSADEADNGSTSEALGSGGCGPGYVRDPNGDIGPNGKIIHGCIPADDSMPSDLCGAQHAVLVPPGLAGMGCVGGTMVNGQPVWTCPAATVVPQSLGVVSSAQGACYAPNGDQRFVVPGYDSTLGWTCEDTWTGTSLHTNCLNATSASGWIATPPAGSIFVADLQMTINGIIVSTLLDGGGGGSCQGGCAKASPPFLQ